MDLVGECGTKYQVMSTLQGSRTMYWDMCWVIELLAVACLCVFCRNKPVMLMVSNRQDTSRPSLLLPPR